jgi:DNA polymerase-3 subunit delta'
MPPKKDAASSASSAPSDPRRAATFDDIAGHEMPKALCRSMLDADRVPHAILLQGPEGVGKTTFAWAFAKELLWNGLRGERHGEEGERRRLRLYARVARENGHPDAFHLERAGALGQIRIETVRDFEDERAHVGPVEGAWKVCVIENARDMNVQAANCFLKLLEEPPRHLKFILTNDTPAELLATIKSRCAVVPFHPLPEDDLIAWLRRKTGIEEQARLRRSARLAEGRPGRALKLIDSAGAGAEATLRALLMFEDEGFPRLFSAAGLLAKLSAGQSAADALAPILACYRDALLRAVAREGLAGVSGDAKPNPAALDDLLLHPEQAAALDRLGKRGARTVMAALDEVIREMLSNRTLFQREVHLEGLLIRAGVAMREAGG